MFNKTQIVFMMEIISNVGIIDLRKRIYQKSCTNIIRWWNLERIPFKIRKRPYPKLSFFSTLNFRAWLLQESECQPHEDRGVCPDHCHVPGIGCLVGTC